MADLLIAPAARADLIAQWDFFAMEIGDPDLADRFVKSAQATFQDLAATPGLGRKRIFPNQRASKLRSWKIANFPNYLAFYRPLSENRGIEIVRILHGARDLDALFEE